MPRLTAVLEQIGGFSEVTGSAQGGARAFAGLCAVSKAHFISAYASKQKKPALVIVPDEATAAKMSEDLNWFYGGGCEVFPYKDVNFFEAQSVSREAESARLRVLGMLRRQTLNAVVLTPDAAMSFIIPPDEFEKNTFSLYQGETRDPDELMKRLVNSGFVRVDKVDSPGQFSRRGDIVDIFAQSDDEPVRIEFWGDEIDSICRFDKDTQRRGDKINSVVVTPAREMPSDPLLSEKMRAYAGELSADTPVKAHIFTDCERLDNGLSLPWADKYLTIRYGEHRIDEYADFCVFICEFHRVRERCDAFTARMNDDLTLLLERGLLIPDVRYSLTADEFISAYESDVCILEEFLRTGYPFKLSSLFEIKALPTPLWKGSIADLADRLVNVKNGGTAVVLAGTKKAADNIASDLVAQGFTAVCGELPDNLCEKTVYVSNGHLSSGTEYADAKFTLISYARWDEKVRRVKSRNTGEKIASLDAVSVGDAVVHAFHGVGIYEGVHKVEMQGVVKDYIKIRYKGGDTLYVPVTQLDLVNRYIGDEETVKLSKMGGTDWSKTKARVKASVRDMAKELISLYSRRMSKKGCAFPSDGEWQYDFESRFEYTETEDQITAADEIKRDMEKSAPMDRLLCGDVGFGKTEVALRAAFKCVTSGKQCAILVPTTLLAWQHYQTIMRRFEGFPIRVGLLCRFRSKKQQLETLSQLARGEIDIAVGTHRLVQNDVKFYDLGLMIIDEEQRFGVAQKEFLKQKYDTVDCLSLSATPIPRTLNMALSGIRDMSTIEEAPGGRQPVQTYVTEYDEGVILETIRRELRRGGQVYYLHNNTETIDRVAYRLQQQLPDAKIAVAHGRMSEAALNRVWEDVVDRKVDILVCTTIIETGVDVPNANTLIIEDADRMGLSQLHQIRGRIGRSYRTAYAYFTFRRGKAVSEIASKRLEAIREFTEFGSGFKIALRDLEIRGAGNVLGGEQHGHMDAVGYDMYVKLLNEAVAQEMGKPQKIEPECTVDLPITAHIPESYITQSQRIDIYRRIAAIRTENDARDVLDELIDRYGEPPASVTSLVRVALCRSRAKALGITEIGEKNGMLIFYVTAPDSSVTSALVKAFGGDLRVSASARPYYALRYKKGGDMLSCAESFLTAAENTAQRDENC